MAEGHEVRHPNLRSDSEISERGALRTHQSIAASVRLGTKQYRRRTGSLFAKKVPSLFEYGAWLPGRNLDSASHRQRPEIPPTGQVGRPAGCRGRTRQSPKWTHLLNKESRGVSLLLFLLRTENRELRTPL